MAIPDYQTLMRPLLALATERPRPIQECISILADQYSLPEEERTQLLPSGRQTILANRTHWAATYMVRAGLLNRPRRGVIAATERGREILIRFPDRIDNNTLSQFDEFQQFRERSKISEQTVLADEHTPVAVMESQTPEERIGSAYEEIEAALRAEILNRIIAAEPLFFEQLIVDLMLAMGYGGAGSGKHLGRSGDGGIDGVIFEDVLGLDIVYLQAKRYAAPNTIRVEQIREFAGSLDEKGATKGVFVTTSSFAPGARAYAERSPKRLVLIDGNELTRLMVRYDVGVRSHRKVDLKRIDEDYFPTTDE